MIELDNRTSLKLDEQLLQNISKTLTKKEIELIITTECEMRQINKEYRDIDKSTDVLSFPYDEMPILGGMEISCRQL